MHIPALCAWYAVGEFTVPKLTPQESAALIVLGASALLYRTFRERYLLIWIAGWLAYLASRTTLHVQGTVPAQYVTAVARIEIGLAVSLFSAAVLIYTHTRKWIVWAVAASATVAVYGAACAVLCPGVFPLSAGFEAAYRLIGVAAAAWMIRFRWDRGEAGPWLMGAGMLLLHTRWPFSLHMHPAFGFAADMLLGVSMLVIVFDDSRMRMRRLGVINALTTSITRAQQHGPMMATALEELKSLMRARAAWFRLVEDGKMVMAQHIGLSAEFLRERTSVPLDDKFEETLSDTAPIVVRTASSDDTVQRNLQDEGFEHVVLLPVRGKKSIIGTLTLGSEHHIQYTPEEMEFLATTAHQLGLAVENLRLVEQILRSHRQWTNTFDSIQDVVLVHDSGLPRHEGQSGAAAAARQGAG